MGAQNDLVVAMSAIGAGNWPTVLPPCGVIATARKQILRNCVIKNQAHNPFAHLHVGGP
jgi:hypothetical protein